MNERTTEQRPKRHTEKRERIYSKWRRVIRSCDATIALCVRTVHKWNEVISESERIHTIDKRTQTHSHRLIAATRSYQNGLNGTI